LVQLDDSVVIHWDDYDEEAGHITRIASDGTLIAEWDFPWDTYGRINHTHFSHRGSDYIHVWFFTGGSTSEGAFYELNLTTGALELKFSGDLFSSGENLVGSRDVIFGP